MQSRRVLNAHEKEVVAYHEAGHALCAELLPGVDRVHKISIVPRGKALGYTLNLPDEDRYLKTREELIDHMTVLLGGRVAEQLVFGEVTTGASRRPQARRAGRARDGLRLRDGHARRRAARRPRGRRPTPSSFAACATRSSSELAFEAQRAAQELITGQRDKLEELARQLLEHEVLEREDIDRIMEGVPRMERRARRRRAARRRVVGTDATIERDEQPRRRT